MSRRTIFILGTIAIVIAIYFLGPRPSTPVWNQSWPVVPREPAALEAYIAARESQHKLKPDNEARVVWADSSKQRTEYSIVYLHGFSASQGEGDPIHRMIAKEFGCNLYLARLSDHGIDTTEQLLNFTPDRWWASSKEALAIGKAIGKKVIIMSTSTGGTMGLILASEYPTDVSALVNLSPNIRLFHPMAFISNNPWGLYIGRAVIGGKYNDPKVKPGRDAVRTRRYWNDHYRLEAVAQLEEMLENKMTRVTFGKVKQPSLSLYYYKNEAERDSTVSVSSIIEMESQLGTPDSLKVLVDLPEAGDHVIGSSISSKDLPGVQREIEKFLTEKLHLQKVSGN